MLFSSGQNLFAATRNFEELLKKGIYEFRRESYDEALQIFKKLRESDPNSSLAAYYLGLTYKRLENYVDAKSHLEASLGMAPRIKGALIELIDLLYRLDQVEEAKKWIKIAEDEGIRPAQAAFLKGLTLIKAGEYEKAVQSLEDAKRLDENLTQSADYQIALAYVKMEKLKEAKELFRDIVVFDPHTDIAEYASRYVDAIERKLKREKPLNLALRFAFEYDSNVILKPSDTSLVTEIVDKADTRQVWDFRGDYTWRSPNKLLSLKSGYGLRVSKQNDFGTHDIVSNNLTLQPALSFEKVRVAFPTSYNHTVVNEKNYLTAITTGNLNNISLGRSQMAQLGALYKHKAYLRPPYGAEDRTGNELIGTGGLFWFFANNKGFTNLRYSINKDWTKGTNWEYLGNKISAGLLIPFWERFKFDTRGELFFQNFNHTHSTLDQKREDQTYSASSLLSVEVVKNALELQCQYTYIVNKSNLNVYEYDRHIISVGVEYKF